MLVNGVDISMLEGWMIKINSNPSFFGKNMNRRWFKVGFVPGPGSEKKLVISYSTSKTAKDPRGWLYVEDVSGIYCRREMIEIVSPSRTLRLKGETAVEHRLWSDSLYKLCNPPPKSATAVVDTTPAAEPRRDHTQRTQRDTKQVADEDEDREQRKRRSDRERDRERERHSVPDEDEERGSRSTRSNRRDDSEREDRDSRRRDRRSPRDDYHDQDTQKHRSSSPTVRELKRGERQPSRRSPRHSRHEREESGRSRPSSSRREERESSRHSARSSRHDREDSGDSRRATSRREEREHSRRSPRSSRHEREESGYNRRPTSRHDDGESSRRSLRVSRHEREESGNSQQSASSRRSSEHDPSDDDSSEDGRDSPRPSTTSSTRSLLVAQIKSGSSFEADIASARNLISDSEEEDDNDYHQEKKDADPEESPREPVTSSTNPIDDDASHDELDNINPERMVAVQPFKRKNSEYFDSDEEEHEHRTPSPIKHNVGRNDIKAPISSVTADNNFVRDDWDAEEEPSHRDPTTKTSYPSAVGTGGVAADANFVHEDWDE